MKTEYKTIAEIWNSKQDIAQTYGTLFPIAGSSGYDFMNAYHLQANSANIDRTILTLFGSRSIAVIGRNEDAVTVWNSLWKGYLAINRENFERMYNALVAEYNPLFNVDGEETETHAYTGKEKTTDTVGKRTTNYGKVESTAVSSVSPEDNETFYNSAKDVASTGAHSDSSDAYSDTHEKEFNNRYDTITRTRKGNIGVTKSTELVASEEQLRAFNDFYTVIFTRFIYEYTF